MLIVDETEKMCYNLVTEMGQATFLRRSHSIKRCIERWLAVSDNIFNSKNSDAVLYLVFYLFIPIVITYISLRTFSDNIVSGIYCYVTILVSALNGIYDATNRWDGTAKSVRNTKIFMIFLSNGVVAAYCVFVVLSVLISQSMVCRCDWILLAYGGTCLVSMWDFVGAVSKNLAIREVVNADHVGGEGHAS